MDLNKAIHFAQAVKGAEDSHLGIVTLFALMQDQDKKRRARLYFPLSLGGQGWDGDFPPHLESVFPLLAVVRRGEPMATRTEVLGKRAVDREKALGRAG
jgi:hypothetical protein